MRRQDTSQICNFLRQKCVARKIVGGERCWKSFCSSSNSAASVLGLSASKWAKHFFEKSQFSNFTNQKICCKKNCWQWTMLIIFLCSSSSFTMSLLSSSHFIKLSQFLNWEDFILLWLMKFSNFEREDKTRDKFAIIQAKNVLQITDLMHYSVDSIKRTVHFAFHGLFFLSIQYF